MSGYTGSEVLAYSAVAVRGYADFGNILLSVGYRTAASNLTGTLSGS